ncbi:hypothetical protein [uncultured Winogradskyella sp.]|uniref:hypothetical protein n=1 Tax=uncultured Winogradskyella sp. TaxID=395353 RepID=UPI00261C984E|nr:hypothetical protein [uncultured Winogradskyella sp.]
MRSQSKIYVYRTNLKLRMMAGMKGFQEVEIDEIPKNWTKFPKGEDEWCIINMPESENSSACLYKAKENSVFDPHYHKKRKEHMTIMNEGGKMRVHIEDYGTFDVEYPNSIVIPEGVVHSCEFEKDTVIMVVWHPKFKKGWDAVFKEGQNENN